MHTRPTLFESLETRRLMSASCGDALAAEPAPETAMLLPAVQKVREAAARMSAPDDGKGYLLTGVSHTAGSDGLSSTFLVSEQLSGSGAAITDGTSNTIMYSEKVLPGTSGAIVDGTSNTIFFAERYQ